MSFEIKNNVLVKYIADDNKTEIVIPDGISAIGPSAFSFCEKIISVSIPNSVIRIDDYAFYFCKNLKEVIIPDSVAYIGACAFNSCERLRHIRLPDGITRIEKGTFCECHSLEDIDIPKYIQYIGKCAFMFCQKLKSVIIPEGLKDIGNSAFLGCGLKEVVLPYSIDKLRTHVFGTCLALRTVIIHNDHMSIDENAFISSKHITIKCNRNSNVELFARGHDIPCKYLADHHDNDFTSKTSFFG